MPTNGTPPFQSLPRRERLPADGARFRVVKFKNPSGQVAWRVTGWTRDRRRIRENHPDQRAANTRRNQLESEYLVGERTETPKLTSLTVEQVAAAERAFSLLGDDAPPAELVRAAGFWMERGRTLAGSDSAPDLDTAFGLFDAWLPDSGLRPKTQTGLRHAVRQLVRAVGNLKLTSLDEDTLHRHLEGRPISPIARDNERRGLSKFFSWCAEPPRRWLRVNPARVARRRRIEMPPPAILTVDQCKALMRAAEVEGWTRWFTLQLFGGLRPSEAERLQPGQILLDEGEIRIEGTQTKTGRARVVPIGPTLRAWLKAYPDHPPGFSRRKFRRIVEKAKIEKWPLDVARHTGLTHLIRQRDSYAEAARLAGNSETMLRRHYEGRVSKAETKRFFGILPRATR